MSTSTRSKKANFRMFVTIVIYLMAFIIIFAYQNRFLYDEQIIKRAMSSSIWVGAGMLFAQFLIPTRRKRMRKAVLLSIAAINTGVMVYIIFKSSMFNIIVEELGMQVKVVLLWIAHIFLAIGFILNNPKTRVMGNAEMATLLLLQTAMVFGTMSIATWIAIN